MDLETKSDVYIYMEYFSWFLLYIWTFMEIMFDRSTVSSAKIHNQEINNPIWNWIWANHY